MIDSIFENADLIEKSDFGSEFLKIVFYFDAKETENILKKFDHETADLEKSDQKK